MAKIDSLHSIERIARNRIRRLLRQLPDEYIIRDQFIADERISPLLVEGPNNSWAFMGYAESSLPESDLQKLKRYNSNRMQRDFVPINYILLSKKEEDLFSAESNDTHLIRVPLNQPAEVTLKTIQDSMAQLPEYQHQQIKTQFIKESLIRNTTNARRSQVNRDNSADLDTFFLDYDQERATKMDLLHLEDEPGGQKIREVVDDFTVSLINGVAGSGKTLILINRAILYCKKHPDKKAIILIHNKPIVNWVKQKTSGQVDNLEVVTFHAFARAQAINTLTKNLNINFGIPLESIAENHTEQLEKIRLTREQIIDELEYINDYLIKDKEEYLDYERQGRGFALQKSQRELVWQLYELVCAKMSTSEPGNQNHLPSLYIRDMCLSDVSDKLTRYDHIMIDEAQFCAPSWLQLAKLSLAANGKIFMCADPNQGFLKHRLSWRSIGFNVLGRTRKLQIPYRSTYEIIVAANSLLSLIQEDDDDYVKPEFHSLPKGQKPRVIYSQDPADENTRLLNELEKLINVQQIPKEQITILTSKSAHYLQGLVENKLGKGISVNANDYSQTLKNFAERVQIMSINSCTGIESPIVFVHGAGELITPCNNIRLTPEEQQQVKEVQYRKLYVAMTRAAQKLVIFSTERLPDILNDHVESIGRTI